MILPALLATLLRFRHTVWPCWLLGNFSRGRPPQRLEGPGVILDGASPLFDTFFFGKVPSGCLLCKTWLGSARSGHSRRRSRRGLPPGFPFCGSPCPSLAKGTSWCSSPSSSQPVGLVTLRRGISFSVYKQELSDVSRADLGSVNISGDRTITRNFSSDHSGPPLLEDKKLWSWTPGSGCSSSQSRRQKRGKSLISSRRTV